MSNFKVYITYFYNIRFFRDNMIPVSTAVWDPKWFHNNGTDTDIFIDENGIYNGIRCKELSPYKIAEHSCSKECNQTAPECSFMKAYRDYIYSLDFKKIYGYLCDLSMKLKNSKKLSYEPNVCLMVHEKPDNPCSERQILVDWFKDNGVVVEEFHKDGKENGKQND